MLKPTVAAMASGPVATAGDTESHRFSEQAAVNPIEPAPTSTVTGQSNKTMEQTVDPTRASLPRHPRRVNRSSSKR